MRFVSPKEDITRVAEAFVDSCFSFHGRNEEFFVLSRKLKPERG
jgi:hypothetical protein